MSYRYLKLLPTLLSYSSYSHPFLFFLRSTGSRTRVFTCITLLVFALRNSSGIKVQTSLCFVLLMVQSFFFLLLRVLIVFFLTGSRGEPFPLFASRGHFPINLSYQWLNISSLCSPMLLRSRGQAFPLYHSVFISI